MHINHIRSKRLVDFRTLAKLLGISQEKLNDEDQRPKWRRVEVLKELQALEESVFDPWPPN